jgi:hypothetical protein
MYAFLLQDGGEVHAVSVELKALQEIEHGAIVIFLVVIGDEILRVLHKLAKIVYHKNA